jgi:hypothetical protein
MNRLHQNRPGSKSKLTWQIVPLEPCDQPSTEDMALKRVLLATQSMLRASLVMRQTKSPVNVEQVERYIIALEAELTALEAVMGR